jgi:hypothetical protein
MHATLLVPTFKLLTVKILKFKSSTSIIDPA